MKALLSAIVLMVMLSGCAGKGHVKDLAPTPPETYVIAEQIMRVAITAKDISLVKLVGIRAIMLDSKSILLVAMQEGEDLDEVRTEWLDEKHPEYAALANTVLRILTYRLRPLIDQGKTDLAAEYIEAVVDGAVAAIDDIMDNMTPEPV